MRIADPAELNSEELLESVLTATMPPGVVSSLSDAMQDVDPLNSPGPAKMAVLKLDAGPMVAVVYHEPKAVLEVLAPLDRTTEAALAEVVNVLRIPRASVEWVRAGIALSRVYHDADKSSSRGGTTPATSRVDSPEPVLPATRLCKVTASPSLAQRTMTSSETISLMLLITQLGFVAGDISPIIENTPVRVIELCDTILFDDGSEAAPLAIFYTMSDDGSTALIVDIAHLPGESVKFASGTLTSVLTQLASLKFVS